MFKAVSKIRFNQVVVGKYGSAMSSNSRSAHSLVIAELSSDFVTQGTLSTITAASKVGGDVSVNNGLIILCFFFSSLNRLLDCHHHLTCSS